MATATHHPTKSRPPFWRDERVLRVVIQIIALAVIIGLGYVLWFNLVNNLRRQGITTGFGFLDSPIGVRIAGSDLSPNASISRALLVGIKNTFALVVFGLPLLTVIGGIIGLGAGFAASRRGGV